MASVGTLAAGVAHEINNPLTCVMVNLELIKDRLADDTAAPLSELVELVADTREGADRVRKVVRDLRHRARVVRDLQPTGRVINAAQAVPEGRGRENVEVADNGPGIAPEILPRIFDPFSTTKPIGVGTGLGLAIAHRIVSSFGGELTVESELGRGSVFRVTLPETSQPIEPSAPRKVLPPAPRRARILVVDDELLVGAVVRRALDRHHDVTVLQRAQEAPTMLDAGQRFDCILCDLMMPEMSGIELHARLRQRLPDAADRMVFMTGAVTPSTRDFFESVPNERLEKPFEIGALVSLINDKVRRPAAVG